MKLTQLFLIILLLFNFSCKETPKVNADAASTNLPEPSVAETTAPPPAAKNSERETTIEPEEKAIEKEVSEITTKEKAAALKKSSSKETKKKRESSKERKRRKAREAKRAKGKPVVEFKETEFDFGHISQGDKIEHNFVFENTGDGDLEILKVDVTCGCTTPTYPFIPIAPGEKGTIGVMYNSTGKLGNQKPMITIVTNARPHTYKIYLKGVVDAERVKADKETTDSKEND